MTNSFHERILVTTVHWRLPATLRCSALYRSSRGDKLAFRMTRETVLQDHLVDDIAALDATESPKCALPVVALKVGADFRGQVPSAPHAAVLSGCLSSDARSLGKHGVHVNLLFVGFFYCHWDFRSTPCTCVNYSRRPGYRPGSLPSLINRVP